MNQIIVNGISIEDFFNRIEKLIDARFNSSSSQFLNPKENDFISRSDVAGILQISLPTLNAWTNQRILKSYKVGKRVYYKRSEVEHSISNLVAPIRRKSGLD